MKSGLRARVFSAFCLTVLVGSGVWAADPPAAPKAGRIPSEGATVATSYPVFSWDAVVGHRPVWDAKQNLWASLAIAEALI